MKKTLLTLLLLLITFSYAKEDPKRFYNSDITINKIGKVLEVIFEIENMKPNVVLKRLGEKSKFSLKIMIWGAMTATGVSPLVILPPNQNVNALYYQENILEPFLLHEVHRAGVGIGAL